MKRIVWSVLCSIGVSVVFAAAESQEETDLKTLKAAQVSTDGPGLLDYFRKRTIGEADKERIVNLIKQLGDESFAVRDRATRSLAEYGLPAIGLLRHATNDSDVEVARRAARCLSMIEKMPSREVSAAAARHLARVKPDGSPGILLAYLPFADDDSVADEVRESLIAVAVKENQPNPAVIAALDDPSPAKRGAAGIALLRNKVDAARKLLNDADPDVRMRITLTAVGYAKDKSAVPNLINLLADGPANQTWKVEELLLRLAGENGPSISIGKEAEARKKARDTWNDWWSKEGDKVDMGRLDQPPQSLGLTLIVQADLGRVSGKVFEIDRDGKTQWQIENLQQPYDAIVIGKNKVVIAEFSSNQVTMRDFQGTILWHKQTTHPPIALQALPNDHLIVVSRTQICEWDKDRNEVFVLQRERSELVTGGKDRNGDYLVMTNLGSIIRFDRNKKEMKNFSIGPMRPYLAGMDLLPNGHIIVSHQNGISEFDFEGKRTWGPALAGQISSVQRILNGNTLVAGTSDRAVIELDRAGKKVWEYKPADNAVPRKARRR